MVDSGAAVLGAVADSFDGLKERFRVAWSNNGWSGDANVHTNINWEAPSITFLEMMKEMDYVSNLLRLQNNVQMNSEQIAYFENFRLRVEQFQVANLANAFDSVFGGISFLLETAIRHLPPPPPPPPPKVDWEDIRAQDDLIPKDLLRRLKSVESRLKILEPRSSGIEEKIDDIESVYEAALRLPTDIADLDSQKDEIGRIAEEINKSAEAVNASLTRSLDGQARIEATESDIRANQSVIDLKNNELIKKSEDALRGATGVGLASAFENRRSALDKAGIFWTVGLVVALGALAWIGSERLSALKDVIAQDRPSSVIWANALLSLFGVGGPIWFAWLSTKQISTNFKLSEDYAFKASVSKAYEGYRAEAVDIDPLLRERLFVSALSRIEEAPIRFMEKDIHGGPLQELLSNEVIRKNLESVPDVVEKILDLIPKKTAAAAAAVAAPVAVLKAIKVEQPSKSDGEE